MPAAFFKFGNIFARRLGVSVTDITKDLPNISYETLRHARIGIDSVAPMLTRSLFASFGINIDIYIWHDASPQWRGIELLAPTVEVLDAQGNFY